MITITSKSTEKLSKDEIKKICVLKDSYWKFGFKSQLNYFINNIKPDDLHNCFYINNQLIGYTLLRKRIFYILNNKFNYLLFDTLIIKKKFRKKNFSTSLMFFNNSVIKENKQPSFLICNNELVNYYKKFKWNKISKRRLKIIDYSFNTNGLFFNISKSFFNNKHTIKIYINK